MPELSFDPPLPRVTTRIDFFQTVRLSNGLVEVGRARWHTTSSGVVQLIELVVHPEHRRRGYGKQLLDAIIRQALTLHAGGKTPMRRMWVNVCQKQQVIARAFLTGQAFHHVATLSEVLKDEDMLTYVRSFC